MKILVINPGSTSTKLALFTSPGLDEISSQNVSIEEGFNGPLLDQIPVRQKAVDRFIEGVSSIHCVAARGGMVRPVPSGSYYVNPQMIEDLLECKHGIHASNLGAVLADVVARRYNCKAIIADPVGVDEFIPLARYSGLKGIERKSFSHALNLRYVARVAAEDLNVPFEKAKFVGIHLGGGISVAAIDSGKIIDVNNSNEGGPFTPQRTGSLPILQLVDLAFSGEFNSAEDMKDFLTRAGGLVSYLKTDNVEEVVSGIRKGKKDHEGVLRAMAYQISKECGAMAAALGARPDAIFLTGGFARPPVSEWIEQAVSWMTDVLTYPGEREMQALAMAAERYLAGVETPRTY